MNRLPVKHKLAVLLLPVLALVGVFGWPVYNSGRVLGTNKVVTEKVFGLILPHHDLASGLIISSVSKLVSASPDIKNIVVLSPNHWQPQTRSFTTAQNLPGFRVSASLVQRLGEVYPGLVENEAVISAEHGLTVPMTYLREAYPEAEFIPVAVSPYFTRDRLSDFAAALKNVLPPDFIMVVSTDFSHGHMLEAANNFDTESIRAIQDHDLDSLLSFGDDNLDCPACVGILQYVGGSYRDARFEIWGRSHGSLITGNPYASGTSYVTAAGFYTL